MPRGAAFLLILAAACAPPLNPWGFTAGKRLTPRGYRAPGGATYVTGIRDNELGPCTFARLPDGAYACLPDARAGYADEGCQTPVYLDNGCNPPPPLAILRNEEADPCHDLPRIKSLELRPIENEVTASSPTYERTGDECRAIGFGGKRAFALGAPVPETRLVHAVIRSERRGDLFVDYYAADDGSRWLIGARDEAWGYCQFNAYSGGRALDVLCGPARAAVATSLLGRAYAEGCDGGPVAALVAPVPLYCAPTIAEAVTSDGCATPVPHTYFALGAEVSGALVRTVGDGVCLGTSTQGLEFHRVKEEIPSTSFAHAVVRNVGEGLLLRQVQTRAGELLASNGPFFDGDRFCLPMSFADGRTRCVETSAPFVNRSFADAACTEPIAFAYASECVDPPATAIFLAANTSACAPQIVERVVALGEEYTGRIYQSFGPCTPTDTLAEHYFRAGEDVTATLPELDVLE